VKNTDYCPFCGSTKINVDTKQRLYTYYGRSRINNVSASARCSHCFARGPLVSGKVINYKNGDIPDKYASICTTKEDLKKQAIDAWNRRAYEDTICGAYRQFWNSFKAGEISNE